MAVLWCYKHAIIWCPTAPCPLWPILVYLPVGAGLAMCLHGLHTGILWCILHRILDTPTRLGIRLHSTYRLYICCLGMAYIAALYMCYLAGIYTAHCMLLYHPVPTCIKGLFHLYAIHTALYMLVSTGVQYPLLWHAIYSQLAVI